MSTPWRHDHSTPAGPSRTASAPIKRLATRLRQAREDRRSRHSPLGRHRGLAAAMIIHFVLASGALITILPVCWVLKLALSPEATFSADLNPLPTAFTLRHFSAFISSTTAAGQWLFGRQLLNSLLVSISATTLGVAFAATAGYGFSRFRFPGHQVSLQFFLTTQMFPGVVMTIPLYLLLDALGLLNSWTGLALVYSTTAIPFCVWMMKGFFDSIPIEIEEAARLDGLSQWQIFWKMALPLARPGLAITALFSFMTAWNEFILAATFLSKPEMYTLPVALRQLIGDYSASWNLFAAGALVVSTPVLLLFYALQKHLVGGLTTGSVKG